jgi:3-methyladenine DNA glycosylase Mpg
VLIRAIEEMEAIEGPGKSVKVLGIELGREEKDVRNEGEKEGKESS